MKIKIRTIHLHGVHPALVDDFIEGMTKFIAEFKDVDISLIEDTFKLTKEVVALLATLQKAKRL